ncbi:hypothetical protein JCM10295v2_005338 [Rhodotorula toruloides]
MPASRSRQDVEIILQFHQHYTLSASRLPTSNPATASPSITVHQTLPSGGSAVVGSFSSTRLTEFFADRPSFRPPLAITDVRLDEANDPGDTILCAVFYLTGQWSLFRVAFPSFTSPSQPFRAEEVYASLAIASPLSHPLSAAPAPSPTSSPFDPVSLARLHSPLLVTLSDSLTLRFMRLDEAAEGMIEVDEAETPLQSRENWAPVVLDVSRESGSAEEEEEPWLGKKRTEWDSQRFKISLAYSMSVFPASWTVGIQEFTVDVPPPRHASLSSVRVLPKMRISARHATATPILSPLPSTPRRSAPLALPSPHSTPTSQSPVTSIEHSHPFIVTSRVDNTLDVYEIVSRPTPSLTSSSSAKPVPATPSRPSSVRIRRNLHANSAAPLSPLSPPLRIIHRGTLFGHTARVASVALLAESGVGEADEAGVKCVSAGDDGVVKVWRLNPSVGREGEKSRKRREVGEVVDVRAVSGAERTEDDVTEWQRLRQKRRRSEDGEDRPQKVKRVWVNEDQIVVVGVGAGDADETVRVLRFD